MAGDRNMMRDIVVVGGGIAGQAVCEAVRERDASLSITLLWGEPTIAYDRVRLSEILISGEDPQTGGASVSTTAPSWASASSCWRPARSR